MKNGIANKNHALSEFRIRKHRFQADSGAISLKLSTAVKRAEIVHIEAFSCRNTLCIPNGNNEEMGDLCLFIGLCFLVRNEPRV